LRANVEYQNERQRLIAAQTVLKTSLYGLVRLLNIDPHQPLELADESVFFHTPDYPSDETMERAWVERPEMKAWLRRSVRRNWRKSALKQNGCPA